MIVDQPAGVPPLMPPGLLTNGLFRHREGLFRHRLDSQARALFQPGEQIIAAFDGVSRCPRWRWLGGFLVTLGIASATSGIFDFRIYFYPGALGRHEVIVGLAEIAVGAAIRLVCHRLGSRRVMVAMTTLGVVEFRTDWLNRPRAILQRGPAKVPDFYESGERFRNVVIGPVDVYTDRATEKMLWRCMKQRAVDLDSALYRTVRTTPLMPPTLLENNFFRHRDVLFRRQLDPKAQALFESSEQIVVAFDGITRLPRWRVVGLFAAIYGLFVSGAFLLRHFAFHQHHVAWGEFTFGLEAAGVGIGIRLLCRLAGARRVMIAITTLGVVECGTDWLGRPRSVLYRGPGAEPVFYESSRRLPKIGIGPVDVYTSRAVELMLWRTMKRVTPRRLAHFAPLGGPWRDIDA